MLFGMLSLLFACSESNYYKKSGKWHYDGIAVDSTEEPVNFKVIDSYFADRKSTRLNSSHLDLSRMPSSA